jgi:hypothetical protein
MTTFLKIAFALAAFFATLFLCTYTHGRILPEVTVYLVWLQLVLSAWYFAEVTKTVPKQAPVGVEFVTAHIDPRALTFNFGEPIDLTSDECRDLPNVVVLDANLGNITGYTGHTAIPITEKQE